MKKNSSFLSPTMRGDYTIEPLDYGAHHIDVQLVDIFEAPLA